MYLADYWRNFVKDKRDVEFQGQAGKACGLVFIKLREPIIKSRYRPKSDVRAGRRVSVVILATGIILVLL